MATRKRRTASSTRSKADDYRDDDEDFEDPEDDSFEEEAPRTRRRSRAADPEPEAAPARRRRRSAEPEEEERPARRRRRDAEPEEEERPARRSRSRSRTDDDGDKSSRRRTSRRPEPEEEERLSLDDVASAGWSGVKRRKEETSDFAPEFKTSKDQQLLIFLEEEPVAVYGQHWITREGKKSFTCHGKENGCPLCDVGDKARVITVFNVLRLVDEDGNFDPIVMILRASPRLTDKIKNQNEGRNGPIDEGYWAINTNGKPGTEVQYDLLPIKERDLSDDWDIDPLDDDELDEFYEKRYSRKDVVEIQSFSMLEELAEELLD